MFYRKKTRLLTNWTFSLCSLHIKLSNTIYIYIHATYWSQTKMLHCTVLIEMHSCTILHSGLVHTRGRSRYRHVHVDYEELGLMVSSFKQHSKYTSYTVGNFRQQLSQNYLVMSFTNCHLRAWQGSSSAW